MKANKDLLFKYILGILGNVILTVTFLYTTYLAENLKKSEAKNAQNYRNAIAYILNNESTNCDFTFADQIKESYAQPVIMRYDNNILIGANFEEGQNEDSTFLLEQIKKLEASGYQPVKADFAQFYFMESELFTFIKIYPYIQIGLITLFVALAYYLFNTARKTEQNRVWVGMAKETAHQLGTPISAIIAWLEHLKSKTILEEGQSRVIEELQKDIDRLELVADRFSKIGSTPELHRASLNGALHEMVAYMSKRAPRKVNFVNLVPKEEVLYCDVNLHLFNWEVENLIRNTLYAMDGQGTLSINAYEEDAYVIIEVCDTGKGIPSNRFKTVFRPGYSTKKRGWGLGLSLSKRIIEEYHKGKIFVKSSKPNEATIFVIKLRQSIR